MNLKEVAEKWLQENGFDGLAGDACGCEIGDLMPCDTPNVNCEPGYKVPCPGPEDCENDGDCPWHISTSKKKGIDMKTRYKHIHFEERATNEEEVWWFCMNNKTRSEIGYIDYYKPWKQWVFQAVDDCCIFSVSCLQDIIHFIGQL